MAWKLLLRSQLIGRAKVAAWISTRSRRQRRQQWCHPRQAVDGGKDITRVPAKANPVRRRMEANALDLLGSINPVRHLMVENAVKLLGSMAKAPRKSDVFFPVLFPILVGVHESCIPGLFAGEDGISVAGCCVLDFCAWSWVCVTLLPSHNMHAPMAPL